MSEAMNRATIEALAAAITAGDHAALDKVFTDDVVMEWPQSGERIRGAQNRREVYSRFPSLPKVTPRRMTGSGDVWVLEASLDYGDGDPFLCVFVFEMRDGRIAKETGYWSKPFPAPEWRGPWVERILTAYGMVPSIRRAPVLVVGQPLVPRCPRPHHPRCRWRTRCSPCRSSSRRCCSCIRASCCPRRCSWSACGCRPCRRRPA